MSTGTIPDALQGWQVAAGQPITASIAEPPGGLIYPLGARVEVPITRAIASPWQGAALSAGIYSVTLLAIPDPGNFNFVWLTSDNDANPEFEAFIPIQIVYQLAAGVGGMDYPDVDRASVTPSVADVAKLERTRTVDSSMNEYTTFNASTRPTDVEVEGTIEQAVDDVLAGLPTQFDPKHWPQARRVITLYSAMLVEGGFFKEQALTRGGPMPWENEYNSALAKLLEFIREDRAQNNLLGMMEPRTVDDAYQSQSQYWPYLY